MVDISRLKDLQNSYKEESMRNDPELELPHFNAKEVSGRMTKQTVIRNDHKIPELNLDLVSKLSKM